MEEWSKDRFEPHLNSEFTITSEEGNTIQTELVEAHEPASTTARPWIELDAIGS